MNAAYRWRRATTQKTSLPPEDIAPSLREQTVDQPALSARSRARHWSHPHGSRRPRRCRSPGKRQQGPRRWRGWCSSISTARRTRPCASAPRRSDGLPSVPLVARSGRAFGGGFGHRPKGYSGSFVNKSQALVTPPARATSTGTTKTSSPACTPKANRRPATRSRIEVMAFGATASRIEATARTLASRVFGSTLARRSKIRRPDCSDDGKCDELDPEQPVRLARDGKEDRDEQNRDE